MEKVLRFRGWKIDRAQIGFAAESYNAQKQSAQYKNAPTLWITKTFKNQLLKHLLQNLEQ